MEREWKPGEVAEAVVDGRTVRVMRCSAVEWITSEGFACSARDGLNTRTELVDPRPLVVIDPEDREQVEELTVLLYEASGFNHHEREVAAALREFANPTPPKPEEPTGLGAVVEDDRGYKWTNTHRMRAWYHSDDGPARYEDINVVRVLSEGVTP